MNKHTPGPWKLEAGRNFTTKSGEFYITYGKDRYGNALFKDFCELDNNAHLIAAAPDMYEALNNMVQLWNFWAAKSEYLEEPLRRSFEVRIEKCSRALAKADGHE